MVAFLVIYTEAQHRIRSQTVFYIFITSLKKFICIDAPIIEFRHITCIQGLRFLDDLKFRPFNNHFFDKLFHTVASLNNSMKYYYKTKRSQLLYSNWLLSTLYCERAMKKIYLPILCIVSNSHKKWNPCCRKDEISSRWWNLLCRWK